MGQLCSCVRRRGYVDLDNENAEPGCCKKCCKECCDSCTQSISTCCKNFWKDLFDGICCCLPCVQTNDDHGPERVVGDFLFDTAMSKFWHVTLLLTNISISWSIWLVFNDFFLSDAWWAVLLFPGWMIITFIVTYICQLLMFGNQPNYVNDNRVWLYFSFLAMPALIILSDVWLVLSDERLGPSILTNLGEIVGIFFGRRPDTYQGDADYTFLFIKYVILTIMYILSAIFVIGYRWKWNCCGCKDGFEDTKKDYVKKSANFLHTHFNNQNLKTYQRRTYSKYPEDVNEKCETYCRKLFLLRLKEHLWPSTDNDSDCCLGVFTAQNVFYPVKLWVAAVLNVLVVLITAWTFFAFFIILGNNTEAAVGQVQEAAPGYCRLAIVSIEPGLAAFDAIVKGLGILNLDGENIFENVSAIDTSNLATEICNQCNLSTIDAVFDSTVFLSMNILSTINDTIKNGLNLSLIDIDPNSVNTTLFEAVFEALVIVNQSYSIFSQGATESCKVLATLLFFGDTKERIYTTGLTAFLLSVIVGLSASLITFAAWRKKFINHGLKAHTYPYPDSVDVHGLYPSHSYSRFVANFVGNGFASVVAVFLVVSLGSLVSLFFQVNAEIDNGSYIQRVDFWPVLGYPAISFAIYLALDLGLVETVIIPQFLQRRRFKGFGFVSIWLELFYLPKGLFAGLYKIFLLLFYFVAGFIRPDCSVFPFGLENWDASHVSYVSAIRFVYTRYYEYNLDDNDKTEHMQDVNSRNERDNENYKDLFRHELGQPAVKALEI